MRQGGTERDARYDNQPSFMWPSAGRVSLSPAPDRLWRLHGATDDLRGLAFETSFGYALGLELDAELVLLHLQPNLDQLVAFADRIHTALQAQGWQPLEEPSTRSRHASR